MPCGVQEGSSANPWGDGMGIRDSRAGAIALVVVVVVGCSAARGLARPASPAAPCATPGATAPPGCWREVLPLGSGGFPASPGSQDQPRWQPGKFPLALTPRLAFRDELWMTAQTLAYSSRDGLAWTQHDKTDWGGRIYHSVVYFNDKLWLFGGLDYEARTFRNDIWSSADGIDWTRVGTAAWSPRGASTIVAYHDQLWLFGGANHLAEDRSTDGFLNDVWSSHDGVTWTQVTDAAAWSPRDDPGVIVLNDQLYVVGGQGRADVWRSPNGKDWTRLVTRRPVGPAPRCRPCGLRREVVGVRRVHRHVHQRPQRRVVLRRRCHLDPASSARAVGATPPRRDGVPRQDLDLQRQAHRCRRQLGRRPLADDHRRDYLSSSSSS